MPLVVGFIVQYRGSAKAERISYRFVHHLRLDRQKDLITSSAVTNTEYKRISHGLTGIIPYILIVLVQRDLQSNPSISIDRSGPFLGLW